MKRSRKATKLMERALSLNLNLTLGITLTMY